MHLKDERGYFKDEAIVSVMQLIGENEVAPGRCGAVIQCVARHVLNAIVPDGDLPSTHSALRFADRGHVIGKTHITETLLGADKWDLHTDGTSKSGKKYISQQVTVEGHSLSTGFSSVSTENTTTLVDITINLVQELSDIYTKEEAEKTFVELFQCLSGLMSDRASVMKSFGRALNQERQEMLQTTEELQILHCNAHFLLDIAAEREKGMAKMEDSVGRYGHDRLPQFRSFKISSESATSR